MMNPKVFISHAGEDKERFVLAFAEGLRKQGVDAWLDKWEMLPGDSLVDKIFEEGLKDAAAVIVVLSENSVDKRWVREELNAAVVKRVNTGSKLIPVIIDDCKVPEVLTSTYWVRVEDLSSIQKNIDHIVAAIFGLNQKPALGPVPGYAQSRDLHIGDLNKMDALVFNIACEYIVGGGGEYVAPDAVYVNNGDYIVPEQDLRESLEVLDQKKYIHLSRALGDHLGPFIVNWYGFNEFAKARILDYSDIINSVIVVLVNKQVTCNEWIAKEINQSVVIVNYILDMLEAFGHIKQSKLLGGVHEVHSVKPTLRRLLED